MKWRKEDVRPAINLSDIKIHMGGRKNLGRFTCRHESTFQYPDGARLKQGTAHNRSCLYDYGGLLRLILPLQIILPSTHHPYLALELVLEVLGSLIATFSGFLVIFEVCSRHFKLCR